MRLDKFLKVSRIFKRRTVAKEVSKNGRVLIDGRVAKPGSDVNPGNVLKISYGEKTIKVKVLRIANHVRKEDAQNLYEIIEG
ncbi:MAG: RNA-binding S4 domain-containing protein [Candidatus Izimaplasma sp.]|nr:RNA-binding S4 domain-containing protein [Candidatus Izimaplasma bacterium]